MAKLDTLTVTVRWSHIAARLRGWVGRHAWAIPGEAADELLDILHDGCAVEEITSAPEDSDQ